MKSEKCKISGSTQQSVARFHVYRVELEGIEPSSKRGNHTLSTCLFQPLIFEQQQDLDHQLLPYPLNFTRQPRLCLTISDLPAPLDPQIRNNTLGAMSRSITL